MQIKVDVTVQKGFSPPSAQTQLGDSVYWLNGDASALHQPYLVTPGDWVPTPMEPHQSSRPVIADVPGTYPYKCAQHPAETGKLLVCTAIIIAPTGQGGAAFSSVAAPVAGATVSFGNADSVAHWPMPQDGPKTKWFSAAIQPGDISAPVPFINAGQSVTCECALHPGETISFQVGTPTIAIGTAGTTPQASISPVNVPIAAGGTVTWQNNDGFPHQPAPQTGPGTAWFAIPIASGDSDSHVFPVAGSFPYVDVLNPNLTGVVTVTNGSGDNTATVVIGTPAQPVSFSPLFQPSAPGVAVQWTNNDTNSHWPAPVGGPNNAWFSQAIAAGGSGLYTFAAAGTYKYYDVLNPSLTGVVSVG
jgi:plastocyanin